MSNLTIHCQWFHGQTTEFFIANLLSEGFKLFLSLLPQLSIEPQCLYEPQCLQLLVRCFFFFFSFCQKAQFLYLKRMHADCFQVKTYPNMNPDIEICLGKFLELNIYMVYKAVFMISYGSSFALSISSDYFMNPVRKTAPYLQGYILEG